MDRCISSPKILSCLSPTLHRGVWGTLAVTVLWIDASAGASGDMLLGALIDAGAKLDVVRAAIDSLDLAESITIETKLVNRAGLRANKAVVSVAEPLPAHREVAGARGWDEIKALIGNSELSAAVREDTLRVFTALAVAEARVHGIDAGAVHFHEVGGLDSIADIVGVVAAIHDLNAGMVMCSPVAVGSGTALTEHGRLPVPVPAVAELFAAAGRLALDTGSDGPRIHAGLAEQEACTPTAAALLTTLVNSWTSLPELTITAVGVGAGDRDPPGQPNVVRAFVAETCAEQDLVPGQPGQPLLRVPGGERRLEVQCNVDDLDPRVWPYVLGQLLAAGADDAWLVPIAMKKSRPAFNLRVLLREEIIGAITDCVIKETSTIGYRLRPVTKVALARRTQVVDVSGSPVRVKLATDASGRVVNRAAEFEDAVVVAQQTGRALAEVLAEAVLRSES